MRRIILLFCVLSCLAVLPTSSHAYTRRSTDSMLLYNGRIYTMEERPQVVEAILIRGKRIIAIGPTRRLLRLAGPRTELIDLKGKMAFPGFIDPHTHLFNMAEAKGLTLDEAQQLAIENGITAVANMFTNPPQAEQYIRYAKEGNMRIRLFLYLVQTDSCGTFWGRWYRAFPVGKYAPKLWINGIKIFIEGSICGQRWVRPVFSDELLANFTQEGLDLWGDDKLHLSLDEFVRVAKRADRLGYQIAIHAIGDLGVETSLRGLNQVIRRGRNKHRHMILHNYFIRDDLFHLYEMSNIIALIEPLSRCHTSRYGKLVGEENKPLFKRWRELAERQIHIGLDSDWPNTGYGGLNPMRKLYAVVTGYNTFEFYEPYEPCAEPPVDQTITVDQALKMMTIEAAYAMKSEKRIGSLRRGKLADIVVLSDDPYVIDPLDLRNIRILMTIVGGKVEFQSPDF
ncbi:MAG: hypothetical protein DRG83_12255 [Deltaproteobacteria bacterium]|nr:MAG: hypothetical protein DRG83_12255 [Deltaproteobacteria bacterium]